jgi:PPOX class probable F420-dependent enzyme
LGLPTNPSRAEVAAAPVARLATHNPSGAIDLVPITFAFVDDRTIVTAVDHKPKRTSKLQRLDNIRARPDVTVLVDHYDDDWTALWWVRLRGTATVDDAPSETVLAPLVAKYSQYRERRPVGPAIVVIIDDVAGWTASG